MWWVYTRANAKETQAAAYLTIIANEATDSSNAEHLSMVVWLVDASDVERNF